MGKKSRNPKKQATAAQREQQIASAASAVSAGVPPSRPASSPAGTPQPTATYYPSDGPSDVELLQTSNQALQAKLNQWTELGLANNRAEFVNQFVPLDLSESDKMGYLQDLTQHPEADGQWNNLVAEIAAIRSGKGVDRIEGDQVTRAVFYFTHPLIPNCDRQVEFCCQTHNGIQEWRAEG